MFKSVLALVLLSLVAPVARPDADSLSTGVTVAVAAPAEWIPIGRDFDPATGELVYLWEWSEYPLIAMTFTKTPPPPPVQGQGIGQS